MRYNVLEAHPTRCATSIADMLPDASIAGAALILPSSRAEGRPPTPTASPTLAGSENCVRGAAADGGTWLPQADSAVAEAMIANRISSRLAITMFPRTAITSAGSEPHSADIILLP